jgi:hypothetical protein
MSEEIMRKLEKMVGDPEPVMFSGTFREEDCPPLHPRVGPDEKLETR